MQERELLSDLFDELFPVMRSITGPGLEASIDIFARHMPLDVTKIATSTKVFDWIVPPEWHFKSASIVTPDGDTICDSNDSTLHIVNYSEPVDKKMSLQELDVHLHSLPELPDAIPYVTSYYSRTWGFCLPHSQRNRLKQGKYRVTIDSSFVDGGVPFAQCKLAGDSEKEILLTSYLCHPSLANNELSGPLVLLGLYNRIKRWPKRRFTYRFLLNPETIGSLCFLHNHSKEMKQNLVSGLVLTCLGGPAEKLLYKTSRRRDALIDRVIENRSRQESLPIERTPFSPLHGSDERQFCSPGFNFPMGQISRSTYGRYAGYHNSHDTKEFMTIDSLLDSIDSIEKILQYVEVCGNPVNLSPFGEPQLGKRNLYPNMNFRKTSSMSTDSITDGRTQLNRILYLLNLADGDNSLIDIAEAAECDIDDLIPIINHLEDIELLKYNVDAPKL